MHFEGLDLPRLIVFMASLMVYCMPWFIAALRDHHRRFMIGLLNLLFGWTVIGWLIAFLWATSKLKASHEEGEKAEQEHAMEEQVQLSSAARHKYLQAS